MDSGDYQGWARFAFWLHTRICHCSLNEFVTASRWKEQMWSHPWHFAGTDRAHRKWQSSGQNSCEWHPVLNLDTKNSQTSGQLIRHGRHARLRDVELWWIISASNTIHLDSVSSRANRGGARKRRRAERRRHRGWRRRWRGRVRRRGRGRRILEWGVWGRRWIQWYHQDWGHTCGWRVADSAIHARQWWRHGLNHYYLKTYGGTKGRKA